MRTARAHRGIVEDLKRDSRDQGQFGAVRDVYEQMVPVRRASDDPWPPAPCTRSVTALFTDVRGFTRLAERLSDQPLFLLAVLNDHLSPVVRAITRCGGVVEKFVGDGVFATFGAHDTAADHRDRALAAALATVGANEAMNRRKAATWGFRIEVGVGLASGDVVVGRIGTEDRAEIAVLGDAVNVAARLVAQAGPGEVLVAASAFDPVSSSVRADLLGATPIRGRTNGVDVYRLSLLSPG